MVVIMWLSLVSLICFKPAIDLFTVVWSRNGLLQYDSASLGNSLQTFLRNILPVQYVPYGVCYMLNITNTGGTERLNHFIFILIVLVLCWPRHRINRSNLNLIFQQFRWCQVETLRRLVRCFYRRTQISHTCRYPHLFWQQF